MASSTILNLYDPEILSFQDQGHRVLLQRYWVIGWMLPVRTLQTSIVKM
jgi:hypothetical protein